VEADVYVWRYALLVVHASKEQEEEEGPGLGETAVPAATSLAPPAMSNWFMAK